MTQGRLIAVVGPSGVGKDSVMDALCRARPDLYRVRRVITRDAALGDEAFDALCETDFAKRVETGAFCLTWGAHGLRYGIPTEQLAPLARGQDCIVNLSRGVLTRAAALAPDFVVLSLNASPQVLTHRLEGRARETEAEISARLTREAPCIPAELHVVTLLNDGPLQDTANRALAALYPARE